MSAVSPHWVPDEEPTLDWRANGQGEWTLFDADAQGIDRFSRWLTVRTPDVLVDVGEHL